MKILLSSTSLITPRDLIFWHEYLEKLMNTAAETGFDGVEVVAFRRTPRNHAKKLAKDRGLTLHFHETWSLQQTVFHYHEPVLWLLGLTPLYRRRSVSYAELKRPFVAYANQWQSADRDEHILLQTHSQLKRKSWNLLRETDFEISYAEFLHNIEVCQLPVVWDFLHFIEMKCDVHHIADLSSTKGELFALLREGWEELGPYVREIHLTDFDPSLSSPKNKNCWPGSGVMPIEEIAKIVTSSGFDGVVVPEVSPHHLSTRDRSKLRNELSNLVVYTRKLFKAQD